MKQFADGVGIFIVMETNSNAIVIVQIMSPRVDQTTIVEPAQCT